MEHQIQTPKLIDVCNAILSLNIAAKSMHPAVRAGIYALKTRLCVALYRQGYCVHAVLQETPHPALDKLWRLTFVVDGVAYCWHQPASTIAHVGIQPRQGFYGDAHFAVPRKLTPRERGALVALVARWLSEVER